MLSDIHEPLSCCLKSERHSHVIGDIVFILEILYEIIVMHPAEAYIESRFGYESDLVCVAVLGKDIYVQVKSVQNPSKFVFVLGTHRLERHDVNRVFLFIFVTCGKESGSGICGIQRHIILVSYRFKLDMSDQCMIESIVCT